MVKTLTVTEEAYERLSAKKEPGESFSNVIIKITGKANLMDIAGILSKSEAAELRKHIANTRKGIDERISRTARRFQ